MLTVFSQREPPGAVCIVTLARPTDKWWNRMNRMDLDLSLGVASYI